MKETVFLNKLTKYLEDKKLTEPVLSKISIEYTTTARKIASEVTCLDFQKAIDKFSHGK